MPVCGLSRPLQRRGEVEMWAMTRKCISVIINKQKNLSMADVDQWEASRFRERLLLVCCF
jgi:hypothetical protein